jgi:fermentation-respiration switch protein FrsA (DUF1100 family)
MAPLGANIFIYDYRGYGKSEGSPSEAGVYVDGVAAYDYVTEQLAPPGVPIVLWGRSLGGAVATETATQRHADGLILESTFTSAHEMATSLYPFLPFVGSLIRSTFDSESRVHTLDIPSLHIHGDEDRIVPLELGQKLFAAAQGKKDLYIIPGAGHNDTYVVGGNEYVSRVRSFLESLRSSP